VKRAHEKLLVPEILKNSKNFTSPSVTQEHVCDNWSDEDKLGVPRVDLIAYV
jgi:hypothetical protein